MLKNKGKEYRVINIFSFEVHLGISTTKYTKTKIYVSKLVIIFFFLVCFAWACVCVQVYMCVQVGALAMCIHMCGGQKSQSGAFLSHNSILFCEAGSFTEHGVLQ